MVKAENIAERSITSPRSNREPGIELLRVVLMIMIVCYHFFSLYIQGSYDSDKSLFYTKLFFTTITVMGVDCFVFISGYYGLRFKLKQVVSLVVQTAFYSYLVLIILYFVTPERITLNLVLKYLFPISSSLWWFITTYILLYFISPFLNAGINSLSRRQYQVLLAGFLYLNCFSNFFFDLEMAGHMVNFIFIYLLARYIKVYGIEIKKPLRLYLSTLFVMVCINVGSSVMLNEPIVSAGRYTSILTILSAVFLFFVFKNVKFKSQAIFKIAPLCLGVYLFHFNYVMWNLVIMKVLFYIQGNYNDMLILYVVFNVLFALLVFSVSLSVEKLRQLICQPILNFVDKKTEKLNLNI